MQNNLQALLPLWPHRSLRSGRLRHLGGLLYAQAPEGGRALTLKGLNSAADPREAGESTSQTTHR